mgnify:CR=1 FL=1
MNKSLEIPKFDKPLEVASFMAHKTPSKVLAKNSNEEERLTLLALILALIFTALVYVSVQLFGAPRL